MQQLYPSRRILDEMRRANQRANRTAAEQTLNLLPLLCLDVAVWTIALSSIIDALTQ